MTGGASYLRLRGWAVMRWRCPSRANVRGRRAVIRGARVGVVVRPPRPVIRRWGCHHRVAGRHHGVWRGGRRGRGRRSGRGCRRDRGRSVSGRRRRGRVRRRPARGRRRLRPRWLLATRGRRRGCGARPVRPGWWWQGRWGGGGGTRGAARERGRGSVALSAGPWRRPGGLPGRRRSGRGARCGRTGAVRPSSRHGQAGTSRRR